jgi:(p)ppGpp synthase/HD superfamily hydrolase
MNMLTEKKRLLGRLEKAISSIPFTQEERGAILTSFNISFEGHRLAPRRATGEIYFMHVFRQCMKMIRLMIRHGVHDANLLCIILLHDVVEDAEEGKTSDFMVRSQIHLLVNDNVVYGVMCMTKKKNVESRDDFLPLPPQTKRRDVIANDVRSSHPFKREFRFLVLTEH